MSCGKGKLNWFDSSGYKAYFRANRTALVEGCNCLEKKYSPEYKIK